MRRRRRIRAPWPAPPLLLRMKQLTSAQRSCRTCFEKKQLRARRSQRSYDVLPAVPSQLLPPSVAVGFSAHAGDVSEDWEGADYLTFGPLRETPSKQGLLEPVGLEGLERAAQRSDRPVLAIGGVRPEDVQPARTAGAAGVAVLSGILGAEDVARATESYLRAEEHCP